MNIKNDSECKEYNSLKYKTMIMNGTNIESSIQTNEDKINNFLSMDIEQNKKGVWSKLSKTEKIKKIKGYIKNNLVEKYKLSDTETINANRFFSLLMDRKKLSKNNELIYNQEGGLIESIEGLIKGINEYNGGIILITHDMYLIESIQNGNIYELSDYKIKKFNGTFDEYCDYVIKN